MRQVPPCSCFAEPANIGSLKGVAVWAFFAYCCMNTLIGYGSFGEALKHWEASKVSVVTTLIPVFTMMFSILGHHLMPDIFSAPDMNGLAYAGAFVVVGGAVMAQSETGCLSTGNVYDSVLITENAV